MDRTQRSAACSATSPDPPGALERAPEATLALAPSAEPVVERRRTVRTPCPVCRQPRVLRVCEPCGVDVDTGELVRAPSRPAPPARGPRALATPPEVLPPPWTWRDVKRGLGAGLFGAAGLLWLVFSLQVITAAVVGVGGGSVDRPGGAALPAQVVTLFLVAYALVARARGVLSGERPYALEDLAPSLLRAVLALGALAPSLGGPLPALLVAAAAPLVLGALASERPLHDLTPLALGRAAARSDGLLRATCASMALLGPALALVATPGPPLAIWRPALLVLAASVVGLVAGFARRAAEARRG